MVELANDGELYEADEHAWIERQVAALCAGQLDRLDGANLIQFLTAMALGDVRELESRLEVVCAHILKSVVQTEKPTRSWLPKLPSLKHRADAGVMSFDATPADE